MAYIPVLVLGINRSPGIEQQLGGLGLIPLDGQVASGVFPSFSLGSSFAPALIRIAMIRRLPLIAP